VKKYAAIIIGSGSAGFAALEGLHEAGVKPLAMVERRALGGECPNFACVPTKALLKSAEVFHVAQHAKEYGIIVDPPGFNWGEVLSRMRGITARTGAATARDDLKDMKVDLLWGEAIFRSPHELEVAGQVYEADRFVIATGSEPRIPDIPGLAESGYVTSDEIISIEPFPRRLAILGGGPVGLEMSQIFGRFGSEVTLIQSADRILPHEEPEVAELVRTRLEAEGIKILTSAQTTSIEQTTQGKRLRLDSNGRRSSVLVDEILIASGRQASTGKLVPEKAGITLDEAGNVVVDLHLQTSAPHIWAAGDVVGGYLYTHAAAYGGWVVGQNSLGTPHKSKADFRVVPRGVFTDPEVGSVGITEAEARKKGGELLTSLSYYGGGRSLPSGDGLGLIKLVVDAETDKLLGASLAGPYAAEVVHELALAMQAELTIEDIGSTIHAFPTYSESILSAISALA
jgi:mercuric reductase